MQTFGENDMNKHSNKYLENEIKKDPLVIIVKIQDADLRVEDLKVLDKDPSQVIFIK